MSSIAQTLADLLGSDAVIPWEAVELPLKAQISQAVTSEATLECVVYPTTQSELAEVITCAAQNRWRVLPCGSGSKLHQGGLAEGIQILVSTARLDRLIEHASGDLTVTAEAGMRFASLQASLSQSGQFLAIDPAYGDQATLGGIVATADTGSLRQRYGGIRDMLIGLSLVRTDGKMAKAGGRVVKNVAGYDLMKLMTGSYGTLGILSQLTFRIYPLPATSQTVLLTGSIPALTQATATILASTLTPTAFDLLTPALVPEQARGTGMGLLIRFQTIEVSVIQQVTQVMQIGERLGLSAIGFTGSEETALWQQLSGQINPPAHQPVITCKIGVEPAQSIAVLRQVEQLTTSLGLAVIHAGSGLGTVSLPLAFSQILLPLRQFCQTQGGFLTLLSAPLELKQTVEVWGYPGNALPLMQRLKTQFDPDALLSPRRFVGNI